MKILKKLTIRSVILPIAFMAFCVQAQENEERQLETEIYVTSKVEREIPQSERYSETPVVVDTVYNRPTVEYPFLVKEYMPTVSTFEIKPVRLSLPYKLPKLSPRYLKVGFGSVLNPLLNFNYGSDRNRNYFYNLNVNHYSSWLPIKNYPNSTYDFSDLNFNGKYNFKHVTGYSDVSFYNHGFHNYGLPDSTHFPKDTLVNRHNFVRAQLGLQSPNSTDKFLYDGNVAYSNFVEMPKGMGLNGVTEHRADANFTVQFENGTEVYSGSVEFINNYQLFKPRDGGEALTTRNNFIFKIRPLFSSFGRSEKWKARIGFELVGDFDSDTTSKWGFFPIAHGEYTLFDGIFIPYVGITGGHQLNSYQNVSKDNPHVLSSISYTNTFYDFQTYVGFKGKFSKTLSFDTQFNLGRVRDGLFYVNDTLQSFGNQFTPVKDTMYQLTFHLGLDYQLGERLNVELTGDYFIYYLRNELYAWNRPDFNIGVAGSYNLMDKFYIKTELYFQGGRKAKGSVLAMDATEIPDFYNLGFLADVNLSFEYRYSKKLSVFAEFNNFAAQKYQRWLNYPVQGFQALIGFTFGF